MISIVMIGYNAEKTFDRAMKSVLRQSMKNIEIILVDDCSNDRTLEMMREYAAMDSRITVLHHERNMGIFGARYTGIMKASGTYTLLMDPDDELMEDACEQLEREMERQHVDCCALERSVNRPWSGRPAKRSWTAWNDTYYCRSLPSSENAISLVSCSLLCLCNEGFVALSG